MAAQQPPLRLYGLLSNAADRAHLVTCCLAFTGWEDLAVAPISFSTASNLYAQPFLLIHRFGRNRGNGRTFANDGRVFICRVVIYGLPIGAASVTAMRHGTTSFNLYIADKTRLPIVWPLVRIQHFD